MFLNTDPLETGLAPIESPRREQSIGANGLVNMAAKIQTTPPKKTSEIQTTLWTSFYQQLWHLINYEFIYNSYFR